MRRIQMTKRAAQIPIAPVLGSRITASVTSVGIIRIACVGCIRPKSNLYNKNKIQSKYSFDMVILIMNMGNSYLATSWHCILE